MTPQQRKAVEAHPDVLRRLRELPGPSATLGDIASRISARFKVSPYSGLLGALAGIGFRDHEIQSLLLASCGANETPNLPAVRSAVARFREASGLATRAEIGWLTRHLAESDR